MKKAIGIIVLVVLVTGLLTAPDAGRANSKIDQIDQEIEALRKQQEEAKAKAEEAQQRMSALSVQITEAEGDLEQLMNEIAETDAKLRELQTNIANTETQLEDAEMKLKEAEERVAARDLKLQSRLKIMYMNGSVSYLEVLLNSTSFTDFLDRFDGLKSLVDQDKQILVQNEKDQEIIENQKLEIEQLLASLAEDYTEMEKVRENLLIQEKQKEVMIASLESEHAEVEQYSEEQDELLRLTASQIAEKINEKLRLEEEARQAQGQSSDVQARGDGFFAYPFAQHYPKTSNFGYRINPITGEQGEFHGGVDIGAPGGTPILASAGGTVIHADYWSSFGNIVIIDHHNGYWSYYAHMSKISVKAEQTVEQGDKIGEVGTTGSSTGNHLHIEIRKNNGSERLNPADFIDFD